MSFVLAIAGLLMLLLAGDSLVRGAVSLSLRLGIPALIVSLTIVAFGTSAPELLIGVKSALSGAPGIALGNVVGSNIANVLLVLGVPALLAPLATSHCDTRRSFVQMLGASAVFIVLCFMGPLNVWHGLVLLALFTVLMAQMVASAMAAQDGAVPELEEGDPHMAWWKIAGLVLIGLIGLPLGAQLLIDGALKIADAFGVSEAVIGLTLVAIGTSLPELATTVMAALRNKADVALGNVIGSNLFNLLAIMGVTSLFGPLFVDPEFVVFDLWVMLAASLILIPFVFFGRDIGRVVGAGFVVAYAIYMAILI